ncbi:MAG: hypothetical protein ACREMY_11475, partial [bacterium]
TSCARIHAILDALLAVETALRAGIRERTAAIVADISGDVQDLWSTLHPSAQISDIQLWVPPDNEKAVDIALTFYGKEGCSPRNTLSEGFRNSLALCIFLALLLRDERTGWPIVLDDIVSSYDREHRGLLLSVLCERFADRQVIIFTHDRLWWTELRVRLPPNQWNFVRLGPWTAPSAGIRVIDASHTFEEALELIEINPATAASTARGVMDRMLARIAEHLMLAMPFKEGDGNDHRTAVEFLDRLLSEAPNRFRMKANGQWDEPAQALQVWAEVKQLLIAWANPETHGHAGSPDECRALIDKCKQALSVFNCAGCDRSVWEIDDGSRRRLHCHCDRIRWTYRGPSNDAELGYG